MLRPAIQPTGSTLVLPGVFEEERTVHFRARDPYLTVVVIFGVAMSLGIGFSGCCSTYTPLPTNDELASLGALPQGADYDSLMRGRALAVTECAPCHRFIWPYEYPPEAWPSLVSRMGSNRTNMSRRQIGDVTRYMVAASRATGGGSESNSLQGALDPEGDPETLERGRMLAIDNCAECHRLYAPHEYSPSDWIRIVQSKAEFVSLTPSELMDIARYYANASRQER